MEELTFWNELLEEFKTSLENSIVVIKEKDVEDVPGAKEKLINKFEQLKNFLPENDGELLKNIISNSIENSFFPKSKSFAKIFNQILDSRKGKQDFIIQELINGFISSRGKTIASGEEGPILDHLVEAFKKTSDFKVLDYQFYAMFGNPDKPRKYVINRFKDLVEFLGLEREDLKIEKDISHGTQKTYSSYKFPEEITKILEGKYIEIKENGEKIITDKFDKMVFISYFLAKISKDRNNLDVYSINGISGIFSLILIISLMPKLEIDERNPLLRDSHFDPKEMSVIPKSWLTKDILSVLLPSLIKIVAFRIGGMKWLDKIALSDNKRKIHLQAQFLLKDVNKWVLGNMCRVEIPIFVEISNIINEIVISSEKSDD
jgi:hypothetical protein